MPRGSCGSCRLPGPAAGLSTGRAGRPEDVRTPAPLTSLSWVLARPTTAGYGESALGRWPIRGCSECGRVARQLMTDSDRRSPPCALVIFGASGDLTARKLLPALERLAAYGALPPEVAVIGVARTPMTDDEFREYCR